MHVVLHAGGRQNRGAMSDDAPDPTGPGEAPPPRPATLGAAPGRVASTRAWAARVTATQTERATTTFARWRERSPLVDAGVDVYERDRAAAGTVLGSAVAFRLFLFVLPFVLLLVGLAGFLGVAVEPGDVNESVGVSGTLADQIRTALSERGGARWLAVLAGLVGMASAGRSLTKVLSASSALAWGVPVRARIGARVIATVTGLIVALGFAAALVNRVRTAAGVAVASVSIAGAAVVYSVAWLLLSISLPRRTTDPGAAIPGAVVVGFALALLQAATQLVAERRLTQASELYGAIGTTVVTLGWFFVLGRVMVFSHALDAAVYDRFGSVSRVFFGLPLLRALPRRFPVVERFFDLEGAGRDREPG